MLARLSSLLLAWWLALEIPSHAEIPNGEPVKSPDGKRYFVVEGKRNDESLVLVDTTTKRRETVVPVTTFVETIHWSPSSDSAVVIQHLAGGSFPTLIRRNGKRWVVTQIEPNEVGPGSIGVTGTIFKRHSVRINFRLTAEKPNGGIKAYFLYSETIDLRTGRIVKESLTRISEEEYPELSQKRD